VTLSVSIGQGEMGSRLLSRKHLSRREFLRGSLASGLAAAVCAPSTYASAAPHLQFPTEPRQRLAVTSYPFRAWIESPTNEERDKTKPGMDLIDFAAMVVKRFDVHNINPLSAHFRSTDPAYLEKFRAAVARAGSHMVDLGLGGAHFWDPDPARIQAALAYGKNGIDLAVIVGSPSVRQHLGGTHGVRPDVDRAAQNLGRLADYGATKNIVINLENDSLLNEDPFFILKVIEKVGNPYLRALPDFGNSIRGHGAAYNQRAMAQMFPHAFNMSHVKDTVAGDDGTMYKIDLARIFGIAKASGYQGYFSMEWEDRAGDPFQGTQRLVKESLKYLA
jgi:sugar phosphate isomerase/epimerase